MCVIKINQILRSIVRRFTHAAIAFENCDKKYKAVFAEPRSSKSTETVYNRNEDNVHTVEGISKSATANDRATSSGFSAFMNPSLENGCNKEYQLNIICSKNVTFTHYFLKCLV